MIDKKIISPKKTATTSIIWLHGLGATADDFIPLIPELGLPDDHSIRFVFPQAPDRPVTLNGGMSMPAWYDIFSIDRKGKQDDVGIEESSEAIKAIIKEEHASGIETHRIFLAGFSQGGAIALHTGLHYPEKLGGIIALSTYLPLHEQFGTRTEKANQHTPIFMAHGRQDFVVPLAFAEESKMILEKHGYPIEWRTYDMAHYVCPEEIHDLKDFIVRSIYN